MLEITLKKIRLSNYLIVALIIVAALLITRSFMSAAFNQNPTVSTVQPAAGAVSLSRKDLMQYASILEKNPFGRPMKLYPLSSQQPAAKPSSFGTLTDLILVGTVVGPEELSYAIFQNKTGGEQDVFAYNQQVFDYGIVKKISKTAVEIERDSETFVVEMSEEERPGFPLQSKTQPSQKPSSSFARKVGEQEYILDSRSVQASLENPEHILTDARLLPNFVNGRQKGFAISEVIPDGLYHSLGLKNNDILLRVNGLEISNPEVAMQAMTALKGMNRVTLDIIREGKNMSMSYQMR